MSLEQSNHFTEATPQNLPDYLTAHTFPENNFVEAEAILGDAPVGLILDIDEFLINTVTVHDRTLRMVYRHPRTGLTEEQISSLPPTLQHTLEKGGSQGAYGHLPGALDLIKKLRTRKLVHRRGIPLVDESSPKYLAEIEAAGYKPCLYLTAGYDEFSQLRRDELINRGFPNMPVTSMTKENIESGVKSAEWKAAALYQLSLRVKRPLVLMDDNVATHELLKRLELTNVHTILYQGPITRPGTNTPVSWPDMLNHLQTILPLPNQQSQ